MAHYMIYQLSTQPVPQDEYIDEEMYYDGFVGQVAEYVDDNVNREAQLEALKAELGAAAEFIGPDSFRIVDRKAFFKGRFDRFRAALRKLESYSLEEFSGEKGSGLEFDYFNLRKAYSNMFGDYVEWEYTRTLDDFVRNAPDDAVYYIGGVIGYKC